MKNSNLMMFPVCFSFLTLILPLVKGQVGVPTQIPDHIREKRSGKNWAAGDVACPIVLAHKGKWGQMEVCPDNLPADGFSIKVEGDLGYEKDDSALNAVYFSCFMSDKIIHSKEGKWGERKKTQSCPFGTVIIAIRLKSDSASASDNAAATSIDVECDLTYGGKSKILKGEGVHFGTWCEWFRCPKGEYVCGLETLVEDDGGSGHDDTALNDIKFKCCKVDDITFDFNDMSMYSNSTK